MSTENKNRINIPVGDDIPEKETLPTVPFHFESSEDELMQIETATYPNGNQVKRFKLSDGRIVIVRELLGKDMMQIDKLIAKEDNAELRQEKYFDTLYHFAVKIDGKQLPIEDFGKLKGKDYNKVKITAQSLNF